MVDRNWKMRGTMRRVPVSPRPRVLKCPFPYGVALSQGLEEVVEPGHPSLSVSPKPAAVIKVFGTVKVWSQSRSRMVQ
jgi:hypothetical protein